MSDLIDRKAAIDALEREKTYCSAFREGYSKTDIFEKYNMGLTDGIKALKNLPSAQPDIIRCKDCKWFGDIGCAIRIVDDSDKPTENYFCSFAERREERD